MTFFRTLLALALLSPALSFANSIDMTTLGGTLSIANSNLLVLHGSELTSINVNGKLFTGDLGTIDLVTGALSSGSFSLGGIFGGGSALAGAVLIKGLPGGFGNPKSGIIFAGDFEGPVTWALTTLANGTHSYTLTGVFEGEWFLGQPANGVVVELTVNTGSGFFGDHGVQMASGDIQINGQGLNIVAPEPGSLTLLGTGLLSIAGVLRRKLQRG